MSPQSLLRKAAATPNFCTFIMMNTAIYGHQGATTTESESVNKNKVLIYTELKRSDKSHASLPRKQLYTRSQMQQPHQIFVYSSWWTQLNIDTKALQPRSRKLSPKIEGSCSRSYILLYYHCSLVCSFDPLRSIHLVKLVHSFLYYLVIFFSLLINLFFPLFFLAFPSSFSLLPSTLPALFLPIDYFVFLSTVVVHIPSSCSFCFLPLSLSLILYIFFISSFFPYAFFHCFLSFLFCYYLYFLIFFLRKFFPYKMTPSIYFLPLIFILLFPSPFFYPMLLVDFLPVFVFFYSMLLWCYSLVQSRRTKII